MKIKRLGSACYEKMIAWSRSEKAEPLLCLVAFSESSLFPLPPDIMLISMGLAKPEKCWRYAFLTVLFSVLGGLFAYALGHFASHWIASFLSNGQFNASYTTVSQWFVLYGVWIIFLAGFSPIPYKLFTLSAGIMGMPLLPFILASILGRGGRFGLVAALLFYYGASIDRHVRRYIDSIGWVLVFVLIIGYVIYNYYP